MSTGPTDVSFCGHCGSQLGAAAKFCSTCGRAQSEFDPAAPAAQPPLDVDRTHVSGLENDTTAQRVTPSSGSTTDDDPDSRVTAEPNPTPPRAPNGPSEREQSEDQFRASPGQTTASENVEPVGPGVREFADQLAVYVRVPQVLASAVAGLIGALVVCAFGLGVAALFPDESLIGFIGTDAGLFSEAARHVVGSLLVGLEPEGTFAVEENARLTPTLFVAVPVFACAAAAASQATVTATQSTGLRLAWGASIGVPFALLMLVPALSTGEVSPSIGKALVASLVWGALGGVIGTALMMRRELRGRPARPDNSGGGVVLRMTAAVLRPFGVALAIGAGVLTVVWLVQTIRFDEDSAVRGGRSLPLALAENGLFVVEHGVHALELGASAEFLGGMDVGQPLPIEDAEPPDTDDEGQFRVFAYRDQIQPYLLIPLIAILMATPIFSALYAGYALARSRPAGGGATSAAWGALVGPAWAAAAVTVNALIAELLFGKADGESVFVTFLLGGVVLGAAGGLLAAQRPTPAGGAASS